MARVSKHIKRKRHKHTWTGQSDIHPHVTKQRHIKHNIGT